jgi:hypothetical protein
LFGLNGDMASRQHHLQETQDNNHDCQVPRLGPAFELNLVGLPSSIQDGTESSSQQLETIEKCRPVSLRTIMQALVYLFGLSDILPRFSLTV